MRHGYDTLQSPILKNEPFDIFEEATFKGDTRLLHRLSLNQCAG